MQQEADRLQENEAEEDRLPWPHEVASGAKRPLPHDIAGGRGWIIFEEEDKFEPGTKMAWMGKKVIWPPKRII